MYRLRSFRKVEEQTCFLLALDVCYYREVMREKLGVDMRETRKTVESIFTYLNLAFK